jgi:hypothetical protein
VIAGLEAKNLARTPIAESLRLATGDLAGAQGQKIVVLLTDGEETCGGDPAREIQALAAQGLDVRVNIVGFAVEDEVLEDTFREWARLGSGQYFDAVGAEELGQAVEQALRPGFRVLDADGVVAATGVVDGEAVDVPAGAYKVEVLTDPLRVFENVNVGSGSRIRLELESGS